MKFIGLFDTSSYNYIRIKAPRKYDDELIIDWGDSIHQKYNNISNIIHNYDDYNKQHIITIESNHIDQLDFQFCDNLIEIIELPNCTDLSKSFYGCSNLKKISKLPPTLRNLDSTFCDCFNIESIELNDGILNMNSCFDGCINLQNINKIPDSVLLMARTFHKCFKLKYIQLSNNVIDMYRCFAGDRELISVDDYIPKSVQNLDYCFENCIKLNRPKILNESCSCNYIYLSDNSVL